MTHPKPIPEADHKPLTRQECEEAERLCNRNGKERDWVELVFLLGDQDTKIKGAVSRLGIELAKHRTLLPRALADLRRLRELLERAPDKHCQNEPHERDSSYGEDQEERCAFRRDGFKCPACTWNAERERALEGWK